MDVFLTEENGKLVVYYDYVNYTGGVKSKKREYKTANGAMKFLKSLTGLHMGVSSSIDFPETPEVEKIARMLGRIA